MVGPPVIGPASSTAQATARVRAVGRAGPKAVALFETTPIPAPPPVANGPRASGKHARAAGAVPLAHAAPVRRANVKGAVPLVLAGGPGTPSQGPVALTLTAPTQHATALAHAAAALPRVAPPAASEAAEQHAGRGLLRTDTPRASARLQLPPRACAVAAVPGLLAGHARVSAAKHALAPVGRAKRVAWKAQVPLPSRRPVPAPGLVLPTLVTPRRPPSLLGVQDATAQRRRPKRLASIPPTGR